MPLNLRKLPSAPTLVAAIAASGCGGKSTRISPDSRRGTAIIGFRACALALVAFSLGSCADPGKASKANVYQAHSVNTRQEVQTVNILAIQPAKVEVDNTHNQAVAKDVGAISGGAIGAIVGSDLFDNNRALGGLFGGLIGASAGADVGGAVQQATALVDGVQIIYQDSGNRVLSSTQVAKPCEYAPGLALVIVTKANETRIQSNHDCVKGQEMVVGSVSKLAGSGLGGIAASDQGTLDDLERQRQLVSKQQQVQEARTGLAKETSRTDQAERSVNIEIESEEAIKVGREEAINQSIVNESLKPSASGKRLPAGSSVNIEIGSE